MAGQTSLTRTVPALYLLSALVLGIWGADQLAVPAWVFAGLSFCCVFAAMAVISRPLAPVLFMCALAGTGAAHYALNYARPGPNNIARVVPAGHRVTVYGSVDDWPVIRGRGTNYTIQVDSIQGNRVRRVQGRILLKVADTTTALQYGDRIIFSSRIYPLDPPAQTDEFDYRRYLNRRGIFAVTYLPGILPVERARRHRAGFASVVDYIREYIGNVFDADLSPTGAALAKGYLLGETRSIPTSVYTMFRDSGTLHLLAVSGSNVALVLLFLHALMRPFGLTRNTRYGILLTATVLYAGLCYAEPSVLRASIMAVLVLGARILQRKVDLNQIIATAASVILLVSPAQLFDVGFQLSFITAWGLIFMMPRLIPLFEPYHQRRWYRWAVFPMLISAVAQLCSMPIIIAYFGTVSTVSVPANLIVVPLVSVGVIGVMALIVVHTILPILGLFLGSLLDPILRLVIAVLRLFGGEHIPVCDLSWVARLPGSGLLLVGVYVILCLLTLALGSRRFRRLAVVFGMVLITGGLAASIYAAHDQGGLACRIERITGGLAVVTGREGESADVIITSLQNPDYDLCEKVLQPMLKRFNVDTVDRLIVQSATFASLNPLFEFARASHTDTLLCHRSLYASVQDHLLRDTLHVDSGPVVRFYAGSGDDSGGPGLYCHDSMVKIRFGRSILVVSAGISTVSDDVLSGWSEQTDSTRGEEATSVLVIGRAWLARPNDWVRIRSRGFGRIVAPTVRLVSNGSGVGYVHKSEETAPDYIHDIKKMGSMELRLR